jgi:hypothetical protein
VACLVGLWLMASPEVLGYGGAARVNDQVVGPLAASLACVAMWQVLRSLRWANVVLGAWLILAAAVLGHDVVAAGNSVASGLVLGGVSLVRGRLTRRTGGGWRSLRGSRPRDA